MAGVNWLLTCFWLAWKVSGFLWLEKGRKFVFQVDFALVSKCSFEPSSLKLLAGRGLLSQLNACYREEKPQRNSLLAENAWRSSPAPGKALCDALRAGFSVIADHTLRPLCWLDTSDKVDFKCLESEFTSWAKLAFWAFLRSDQSTPKRFSPQEEMLILLRGICSNLSWCTIVKRNSLSIKNWIEGTGDLEDG